MVKKSTQLLYMNVGEKWELNFPTFNKAKHLIFLIVDRHPYCWVGKVIKIIDCHDKSYKVNGFYILDDVSFHHKEYVSCWTKIKGN